MVCGDWASEADLEWAAARIATFGNYQAGQSCIAVQRVIVHADLYGALAGHRFADVLAFCETA